ncbi:MAG: hypothetical protein ABRQ38_20775 [Candidatus Eremiobacterota bacterium]|jgi:hypothetical protein
MPDYACYKCGSKLNILDKKIEWTHEKVSQPLHMSCVLTLKCSNRNCSLSSQHGAFACKVFKRVYKEPEKEGQLDMFEEVTV